MKKKMYYLITGCIILYLIFCFGFASKANQKEQNKGVVSLNFDDGLKSQYNLAFKEMQKYEYKGNLFLLANWTGLFEGRELMSFEEAKEMQDSGWEIGSHTLSHLNLTILSDEKLKEELEKSKEILENKGFEIKTIAFPFGGYNQKIIEETKKHYSASRPLKEGYNSLNNLSYYDLKSKWILKKYSSEEVCSWIKNASEEKLWLILDFHGIGKEEKLWDFSEQKFKEVLECIKNEGIEVKTIKEVLEDEKRN